MRKPEAPRPDFVSAAHGANGSGRERTIEVTETIGRHATLRTMPHLTCAGRPVDQLRG